MIGDVGTMDVIGNVIGTGWRRRNSNVSRQQPVRDSAKPGESKLLLAISAVDTRHSAVDTQLAALNCIGNLPTALATSATLPTALATFANTSANQGTQWLLSTRP